jgi:hypothetical protein
MAGDRTQSRRASTPTLKKLSRFTSRELRDRGTHVVLLIVDAGIEPYAGGGRPGVAPESLADPRQVADAVVFLPSRARAPRPTSSRSRRWPRPESPRPTT